MLGLLINSADIDGSIVCAHNLVMEILGDFYTMQGWLESAAVGNKEQQRESLLVPRYTDCKGQVGPCIFLTNSTEVDHFS